MATDSWVPAACTLPSAEQPLRVAEFDRLFGAALQSVDVIDPRQAQLELRPADGDLNGLAEQVGDLAARETACCSFFTFDVRTTPDGVTLSVEVPSGHEDVLAALLRRAEHPSTPLD